MPGRAIRGGDLPRTWLTPCLVAGGRHQAPIARGTIGRMRKALVAAAAAEHDGLPDDPHANHYHPRKGSGPGGGPARVLMTPCGLSITHSRTDYGERELSISNGKHSEDVRFRIWMPDVPKPVDPDFSSPEASLRALRSYARLLDSHLSAFARVTRRRSAEESDALREVRAQARRVAMVARSWTTRSVMVEVDTPWSGMIVHELDGGIPRGDHLGDSQLLTAWATPPCVHAQISGGRDSPLILSVTALRVTVDDAGIVDVMRAAAALPQTTRTAA